MWWLILRDDRECGEGALALALVHICYFFGLCGAENRSRTTALTKAVLSAQIVPPIRGD